ncbi:putative F0F1-ATPase subunit (Ca2+/Mg2+ transporter) [Epilithonimonas arachidiradicis]|uniref:Putative F0F1-ATPase subunit (Ca2+/Mg2+ transporter) n=1 Tax=Epilithonimonas arachidiradicis TaxID=1617282 RepID=A0A420DC31_9FLAO|nr:putative F0F1-ATPase subunit (Ca2+/Mg2+ transporter) [Epilithonimonas arachidiradicis]
MLSEAPLLNLKTYNQIKKLCALCVQNSKADFPYFCKNQKLEDKKNNASDSLRKYGKYSSVIFQMLFIIGISFWGGHQLDLYFETGSNVLVLVIGLSGLCLSLYTTLKRLEILNKEEQDDAKQK